MKCKASAIGRNTKMNSTVLNNMCQPGQSGDRGVHLRCVEELVELDRLAAFEPPGIRLRGRDHLAGLLVPPGAEPEHHHALALGDEFIDPVVDHLPVATEAVEV